MPARSQSSIYWSMPITAEFESAARLTATFTSSTQARPIDANVAVCRIAVIAKSKGAGARSKSEHAFSMPPLYSEGSRWSRCRRRRKLPPRSAGANGCILSIGGRGS
jgi:hypothetical protein